jgi:hypothetical protein
MRMRKNKNYLKCKMLILFTNQTLLIFTMALFFAVSLILWTETIFLNFSSIQPAFSAYRTELTGNISEPFERTLFDLKIALRIYIYFYFLHDFYCWKCERHGNIYEQTRINACRTHKQPKYTYVYTKDKLQKLLGIFKGFKSFSSW